MTRQEQIEQLEKSWAEDNRWKGIERPYTAEEVIKLRGSVQIEHTLALKGQNVYGIPFIKKISSMHLGH